MVTQQEGEQTRIIYAYVPEAVKKRLRHYAFHAEVPMSEIVENALHHYFAAMGVQENAHDTA